MTDTENLYYQNTKADAEAYFKKLNKKGLLGRLLESPVPEKEAQQRYDSLLQKGAVEASDIHPAHLLKALVDAQTPFGMGWMSHIQNLSLIPFTVQDAEETIEKNGHDRGSGNEVYLDYVNGKRMKSQIVIFPALKKTLFVQGEYGDEQDTNLAQKIVNDLRNGRPLPTPGAADITIALMNNQAIDLDMDMKIRFGCALAVNSGLPKPTPQEIIEAGNRYDKKQRAAEAKAMYNPLRSGAFGRDDR